MLTMRPQRVRDHRHQQRLGDVEEAVQRDVDHARPTALALMPGMHGVVVDAGVVDDDLDRRPPRAAACSAAALPARVGRRRTATACAEPPAARIVGGDALGFRQARVGVHEDVQPSAASRRQIAAPIAPLPPVTSARFIVRLPCRVEHDQRRGRSAPRDLADAQREARSITSPSSPASCSRLDDRSPARSSRRGAAALDVAQADEVARARPAVDRAGERRRAPPSPAPRTRSPHSAGRRPPRAQRIVRRRDALRLMH